MNRATIDPHLQPSAPSLRPGSRNRTILVLAAWVLLANMTQVTSAVAVIQPGEAAPLFTKKSAAGQTFALDAKVSDTVALVFLHPRDRDSAQSLRALEKMFDSYPPLLKGMRVGVIVCRARAAEVKAFEKPLASRWPVLSDEDDALYKGYKIVATPTVVIVDGRRKVAAVHAGFDPGMHEEVRLALAKTRGITLPQAMTGTVEKPNMALQMGRRMAARGLWDSALKYYAQAEKEGFLSDEAKLELAEVQLEIKDVAAAEALLRALPAPLRDGARAVKALERAAKIKAGGEKPGLKPPSITR